MKRSELVEKLEIVSAALSNNTLIPIMQHFWFRGDVVMAYNDAIAISVPCKTDFKCAVPGVMMLNLLKASKAQDVELTHEKGEITIKAASSRMHIGTMDASNFNFDMPGSKVGHFTKADRTKFMAAIEACLRSVSIDTSVPDYLGVTIIGSGRDLLLFATNYDTFTHAWVGLPEPTKFKRAILSTPFCREMIALVDKKLGMTLDVRGGEDNYALFHGHSGSVLFGKLVESPKPLNYEEIFDKQFPEGSEKKLVAIPTKMELVLDRACVVAGSQTTPTLMDILVSDGKAKFITATTKTELFDNVELEKGQANVKLRVDPKLVKNGYGSFDKMMLTERAFIMASKDTFYFVGHSEGK